MGASAVWATEVFGGAELKDQRRTARLVQMAETAAERPGGTVTSVMRQSADRQGAFKFLESRSVRSEALTDAMGVSTAARCAEELTVYVAIDQTDLTFVDRRGVRGLGPDNAKSSKTLRTTQVMNALAVNATGTPIGLLDQQWWLRSESKAPHWKKDRRPPEKRESAYWLRSLQACEARIQAHSDGCRPWYVCDRGADLAAFLLPAMQLGAQFTVRAAHNRVILDSQGRERRLFSTLARQPVAADVAVTIPRSSARRARLARCQVRFLNRVRIRVGKTFHLVSAVSVRETGYVPAGQERIKWRLLTNVPVKNATSALQVVYGYTLRWRVEEVHRTWKTGGCQVERSQLRSYEAIKRWATILAAVATRVERLKRLSRETPDADAITELSRTEIDVAIALMSPKGVKPGDDLTLQQAVRLIAMVGGYMGRRGDGPPGSITIRRGLEEVVTSARAVDLLRGSD